MVDDDIVAMNTRGLDQLIKATKKLPVIKIGVLGAKDVREDGESNATIGAKHEFGRDGMPMRSFLRVPLSDNLEKRVEASGAFDQPALAEVIFLGSFTPWMRKVATLAEAIVLEGFQTGGFGKWKPSIMEFKKTKQTLVETQMLRDSITSEIKE